MNGDVKKVDDLDDDVKFVEDDVKLVEFNGYIARLENLKVVTSGWMHSLQKK